MYQNLYNAFVFLMVSPLQVEMKLYT
ncbi:hypothetical protein PM8797T_32010 [Gimesia maris DSM 8797]|nr:hypothetical protein PM8797T_32010 [Gimesia maris DSM 8797]